MDIPVTILGGYLGAGKTTLINHVLSLADGIRVAVLVNDFGAVNIDASLIASRAEDTITLSNGCVCCTIQDDLGAAIDSQLRRTNPPQHIIIESERRRRAGAYAAVRRKLAGIEPVRCGLRR